MFAWLKPLDVFAPHNTGAASGGAILLYKNMLECGKFTGVYESMKYLFAGALALCLWAVGGMHQAHAFMLTLSESQLNAMVSAVFPQTRVYEDTLFTFSNPAVDLDALEDEISVNVTVLAERDGLQLKATATLSGELFYHAQLGQLQIKEPTLDELEWAEHGNLVPESLLNSLKRMEGKRFPVILLLDFEQLDLSAWGIRQPKRVEITPNGLLIEI